jgi:glycerol uptake facilitator-like aquaporin
MNALRAVAISAWLFGGWGLDARIGRIGRPPAVLRVRFLWIYLIAPLVGVVIAGVVHTRLHRHPLLTQRLCGFDGEG